MVASLLFEGNMDKDIFFLFVFAHVLPVLRGTGRRYLMCDRHSTHFSADLTEIITNDGHGILYRPVHSPDFGFVEICFNDVESHLKRNEALVTPTNLGGMIQKAVNDLTPANVQGYAAHCHYFHPLQDYQPYL